MMSYGSEIFFGGSDNVLEWDKPQCIFKFEKKVFLNDPSVGVKEVGTLVAKLGDVVLGSETLL